MDDNPYIERCPLCKRFCHVEVMKNIVYLTGQINTGTFICPECWEGAKRQLSKPKDKPNA